MRLANEQYEFIKGEVVFLFELYNVRCVPINGFELAYSMGIKLIPYSSLSDKKRTAAKHASNDGFYIEHNDGSDIIYYNDIDISYKRINMTILHEIGHCVLDHTGHSEEEEAEAAFFAKYSAAPPPLVHRFRPNCPEEIADAFDLSYEAACHAYDYYLKWRLFSGKDYTDYEIRLLQLFAAE